MKPVYIVLRNADFTEGRGPMVFDSVWDNPDEAIKYANSIEPYGAKVEKGKFGSSFAYGQFIEIKISSLLSSFEDKRKEKDEEIRRSALAKLSSEQKRVLGLTE